MDVFLVFSLGLYASQIALFVLYVSVQEAYEAGWWRSYAFMLRRAFVH